MRVDGIEPDAAAPNNRLVPADGERIPLTAHDINGALERFVALVEEALASGDPAERRAVDRGLEQAMRAVAEVQRIRDGN